MVNKKILLLLFFFILKNSFSYEEFNFIGEINYPKSNKFINIAVDNVGRIYLGQKAKSSIQVYNKYGSHIDLIILKSKKLYPKGGSLKITNKGEIAVLDTEYSYLKKFDPDGNAVYTLGQRGTDGGNFRSPNDFTIDKRGNIYVADTGNRRIQIFNRDSIYVAVIKSGDMLSSETNNFRLVKHEAFSGRPIRKFPQLKAPVDVEVDDDGNIYVLDSMTRFVVIYNSKGEYMGNIDLNDVKGSKDIRPIAMAVHNNKVFIVDEKYHNIKVFNREGSFLQMIGAKGTGRGEFYNPLDIVLRENKLYILDSGNNRIQILGYGNNDSLSSTAINSLKTKDKPTISLICLNKEVSENLNTIINVMKKQLKKSDKFSFMNNNNITEYFNEIDIKDFHSFRPDFLKKVGYENELDLLLTFFVKDNKKLNINFLDLQSGITINSFSEDIKTTDEFAKSLRDITLKAERSYLNRLGAPLAPVGIFAMSSVNSIFLKWDPNQEEDVISYSIYTSDAEKGTYTKVSETQQNEFQINDLKNDSEVFVKLTALDSEGKESVFSEVVPCKTRKLPDFGYILNVKSKSYAKEIRFKWSNPEKEEISSYQIFRSDTQNGNYLLVGTTKKKKFTDKGLTDGTTYFYKIRKVYRDGLIGDYSNSFEISTDKKPEEITEINLQGDLAKKIILNWKVSPNDTDLKKIQIFRSESSDGDYKLIDTVSARKTSYKDNKLKDNTTYYYKLKSIDKFDLEGDLSREFFATTKDIPFTPFNIAAESNLPRKIKLTWEDDNKGDYTYTIYRSLTADGEFDKLAQTEHKTYTDEKLKDSVSRYYFVTVKDSDDLISKPSDIVSATTKSLPLSPENLKSISNLPKKITVIWDPVDNPDIVSYNIYKADRFNGKYKKIANTVETVYTDDDDNKGLEDNKTYYYKVSSLDSDNLESELSSEVFAKTKNTPPPPDEITIAAYKDTALILSWPPVAGKDIFGYYIYKNRKMIELVKSNIFIDNNVKQGKSYVYQISALDNDKLEGHKSDKVKYKLS